MKYALLLAATLAVRSSFAQIPIDSEAEISIGGIKQYITVQSADTTLPLLLFLHGGPGGSVLPYARRFTDKLQQHFVVVQWDQRETGKTLELNRSPVPLTLNTFHRDTEDVIRYLLKRYKREKLYLVAHSWGTALGFHIARTSPELLYAYVPIGPMINQLESERQALSVMKANALRTGNKTHLEEIGKIHIPFENGEQLYYHRKGLLELAGDRKHLSREFVAEWATRWLDVFNEASRENLVQTLPSIECPVYFFAGRKDLQTNSRIAHEYYLMIKAPKKNFFWFDTGHSIPGAAPSRMQDIIIGRILPETLIIEKPGSLISTQ